MKASPTNGTAGFITVNMSGIHRHLQENRLNLGRSEQERKSRNSPDDKIKGWASDRTCTPFRCSTQCVPARRDTNRPTSVNGRTRKGARQRNRAVQRPLLLFTKTRN